MPKKKEKNLTEVLNKLEKLTEEMNSSELDIELSLKKFKEGAELIKFCKEKLKKAENEFIELKNDIENELNEDG